MAGPPIDTCKCHSGIKKGMTDMEKKLDELEEGLKGKDPFSPDAPLIIMTGPLTGTSVPTSGRLSVVALSPETLSYGESDIGGTVDALLALASAGAETKPLIHYLDNHIEELEI